MTFIPCLVYNIQYAEVTEEPEIRKYNLFLEKMPKKDTPKNNIDNHYINTSDILHYTIL